MATKTIFISYEYENDRHYKNLLVAWDANKEFDFSFYDGSVRAAIDSTDAVYIKSRIKQKISAATHLLCLVGKETHKSKWVDFKRTSRYARKSGYSRMNPGVNAYFGTVKDYFLDDMPEG